MSPNVAVATRLISIYLPVMNQVHVDRHIAEGEHVATVS